MKTIIVPLTKETKNQHGYFFESAFVDVVIEDNRVTRRQHNNTHTQHKQQTGTTRKKGKRLRSEIYNELYHYYVLN